MTAIILQTLVSRRWSVLWWSLAVFGVVFINLILYPSFKDQAAELQRGLANLPPAAVQLLGGSTDFLSPVGFLHSKIFFMVLPLMLSAQAIGLGASLIGREEQDHTLEMLLAQPVSRSRLLAAKAVAGTILVLLSSTVATVTTLLTAQAINLGVGARGILLAGIMCWLLAVLSGAIAYALAATGHGRGAALGLAAGVALAGYIVSSLAETVSWLKIPAQTLPFHYYRPDTILATAQVPASHISYFIAVTSGMAVLAWLSFRRRDLTN